MMQYTTDQLYTFHLFISISPIKFKSHIISFLTFSKSFSFHSVTLYASIIQSSNTLKPFLFIIYFFFSWIYNCFALMSSVFDVSFSINLKNIIPAQSLFLISHVSLLQHQYYHYFIKVLISFTLHQTAPHINTHCQAHSFNLIENKLP
jgi:hypothetical protein